MATPLLSFPYFFPEFQKSANPQYEYIVIPHYLEQNLFSKDVYENIVFPTEPWDEIIRKILDSKFVIPNSLHGIILAEAYGIPARLLRVSEKEPIFKYVDYYMGTNRPYFQFASSIDEALRMGGEPPLECDLYKLYQAFPFEYWPSMQIKTAEFFQKGVL